VSLPTGARLGPYELLGLLGAGGMGEVYKARDTRLDRTVAIKVLSEPFANDPERRERFEREARAVAALNHPHICHLHDVGEAANPQSPISNPIESLDAQPLAGTEGDSRPFWSPDSRALGFFAGNRLSVTGPSLSPIQGAPNCGGRSEAA
jgi:serine/threonine protein kinase